MRPPTRNDGTLPSLRKQSLIDHHNHRHIHNPNHHHSHQYELLASSSSSSTVVPILSEKQQPHQENLDVPIQHSSSIIATNPPTHSQKQTPTSLSSSSSSCSSANLNEVKLLKNNKHSKTINLNTQINKTLTPCRTSEKKLIFDKYENVISCQPQLAATVLTDQHHNQNENLNLFNCYDSFASNICLSSTNNNITTDNNDNGDDNRSIKKIESESANSNVAINSDSDNNQETVKNLKTFNGRCKSSPLLVPERNNSLTLVKNSASLIFSKKDNNIPQIVHIKKSTSLSDGARKALTNNEEHLKTSVCNTIIRRCGGSGFSSSGIHLEQPTKLNLFKNRRSLQIYSDLDLLTDKKISEIIGDSSSNTSSSRHRLAERKLQSHSWYAPVYARLNEEIDNESRESSLLHNLASAKKQSNHGGSHETASLLETSQRNSVSKQHHPHGSSNSNSHIPKIHARQSARKSSPVPPLTVNLLPQDGPQMATTVSIGGQQQNDVTTTTTTSTPSQPPAPQQKCSRFEQLIKTLVGRKVSRESSNINNAGAHQQQQQQLPLSVPLQQQNSHQQLPPLIPSPEIHITKNPPELTLLKNDRITSSTVSLNTSVQKLWNVVPLLKRDTSCTSLNQIKSTPLLAQYSGGLKKCDTVLALSRSTSNNLEPIKPQNRLRNSSSSTITCSRCSSLLSLAANGSRYSLNLSSGGGFIPVGDKCSSISISPTTPTTPPPPPPPPPPQQSSSSLPKIISATTPTSMISAPSSTDIFSSEIFPKYSQKPPIDPIIISTTITTLRESFESGSSGEATTTFNIKNSNQEPFELIEKNQKTVTTEFVDGNSIFMCKLCLLEVNLDQTTVIGQCGCNFCTECMAAYVEFEILEGAYEISCPDALCPAQGILTLDEIVKLCSSNSLDKHNRYRLNREVELDKTRTWCPRAGCETVCNVGVPPVGSSITITTSPSSSSTSAVSSTVMLQKKISTNLTTTTVATTPQSPCSVHCPTCLEEFCSGCKKSWHPTMSCEENIRRLAANGQEDNIGIPFDNDLIKCCPMCAVPIEKDEGCAQMMCKRCKHVFCWYCLASLDDDFLLRHYDRGPCKNKLGHSRASVVWHRAQVIGIFAGFGILLLVASPLLLLAAPCIVCCKCRICNGAAKLEENDNDFDEIVALHR